MARPVSPWHCVIVAHPDENGKFVVRAVHAYSCEDKAIKVIERFERNGRRVATLASTVANLREFSYYAASFTGMVSTFVSQPQRRSIAWREFGQRASAVYFDVEQMQL